MKLDRDIAKEAATAKIVSGGFEPLAPGKYLGRLRSVELRKARNSSAEYWSWEFGDLHNLSGEKQPGRQWFTTTIPGAPQRADQADEKYAQAQVFHYGRLRQVFEEVFDATVETDTEELIGEVAVLSIGIETIQKGDKAGQRTNRVNNLERATDEQIELLDDTASGF